MFHCCLRLGGGAPVEAAVKVLSNKVGVAEGCGLDHVFNSLCPVLQEGSSCSVDRQQFLTELQALSM